MNNELSKMQPTMTSVEIAELTGKQHYNVMQAIRKMEPAWESVTQSKFGLSTYKDAQGKERSCYQLTKRECLYIATKFNDEARAKLVLRWEELETRAQMPAVNSSEVVEVLFNKALEERVKASKAEEELEELISNLKVVKYSSNVFLRKQAKKRIGEIIDDYSLY